MCNLSPLGESWRGVLLGGQGFLSVRNNEQTGMSVLPNEKITAKKVRICSYVAVFKSLPFGEI